MKILEVILQKYEKLEEEEDRKARAQRRWDREKEERDKKKEEAEMERWKNFALKQKRSSSVEVGSISFDSKIYFLFLRFWQLSLLTILELKHSLHVSAMLSFDLLCHLVTK